jgi:hypothetical protein
VVLLRLLGLLLSFQEVDLSLTLILPQGIFEDEAEVTPSLILGDPFLFGVVANDEAEFVSLYGRRSTECGLGANMYKF